MYKKTVEEGLELIGNNNKYQHVNLFFLFSIGLLVDVVFYGIPLMETNPIVKRLENGDNIKVQLNYTMCDKNYTIDYENSKASWTIKYNIYCNKFLVSLIAGIM